MFLFFFSWIDLKDVMAVPNPNDKVVSGLQTKGNQPIPLKKVYVRAKLMDLAAQVNSCHHNCLLAFPMKTKDISTDLILSDENQCTW